MSKPKINYASNFTITISVDNWRQEGYLEATDDFIDMLNAWDETDGPMTKEGLIGALEVIKGRKQQ